MKKCQKEPIESAFITKEVCLLKTFVWIFEKCHSADKVKLVF